MSKFKKNTGKALESLIVKQCGLMKSKGILYLQKVDPPTRTINTKAGKITTLLSNPFPDFVGCLPSGRMVCIEAKSNQLKNLPIGNGGIRDKQLNDLMDWECAGAIVGIVWQTPTHFKWVNLKDIRNALASGRKSVPLDAVPDIPSNDGLLLNFMEHLKEK